MLNLTQLLQVKLENNCKEREELLKVTEGDGKIATLQGYIAGVKDFFNFLEEVGMYENILIAYYETTDVTKDFSCFTENEIFILAGEAEGLKRLQKYKNLQELVKASIEEKKSFLFNEAQKGRDLSFVHGWREAINYFDKTIEHIILINKNNELRGGVFQFA